MLSLNIKLPFTVEDSIASVTQDLKNPCLGWTRSTRRLISLESKGYGVAFATSLGGNTPAILLETSVQGDVTYARMSLTTMESDGMCSLSKTYERTFKSGDEKAMQEWVNKITADKISSRIYNIDTQIIKAATADKAFKAITRLNKRFVNGWVAIVLNEEVIGGRTFRYTIADANCFNASLSTIYRYYGQTSEGFETVPYCEYITA